MNATPSTLNTQASAQFSNLTKGELRLLDAVQSGRIAFLSGDTDRDRQPQYADEWGDKHHVRAELIRWLCTDKEALAQVHSRGIRIESGRIEGELDLSFATIPFPLELMLCAIPGRISFESATIARLSLTGALTGHTRAVGLNVKGDVVLNSGFQATDGVILDGVHIHGSLDCNDAQFQGAGRPALSIFSGKVDGSVFLVACRVTGEVNMTLASVGGNVICDNARFHNPDDATHESNTRPRYALIGSQVKIGGSAFLRRGFEVVGRCQLIGSTIGVDLDCSGATFHNPGRQALEVDRITIGSDVFFIDGFRTDGIIRFPAANVEGSVTFRGAKFMGDHDNGVNFDAATIKRTFVWSNIELTQKTILQLSDASVGRMFDDAKSWPHDGNLVIVGFRYARISGVDSAELRRQWLQLQPSGASFQPYEQLIEVMRAAGHESEARKVAIQREDKRHQWRGWRTLWTWLSGRVLKYTIGYGYIPRRALYWATAVVLLGWLIFSFGYNLSVFSPVAEGVYKNEEYMRTKVLPYGYQTFSPFMYSLDTFLPIIDLNQEPVWLPNPSAQCIIVSQLSPCGAYLRVYLWFHTIIGWALTTLAVGGFTGLIRGD